MKNPVGSLSWPLVLLSAVLLPLALPSDLYQMGNPLVGLICLTPLFAGLCLARGFRHAAVLGASFAGLSTFLAHYWLMYFGEFSVWTVSGVVLGYVLFGSALGPILYGVAVRLPRYRIFVWAATWTVWELIKSTGFLGFPWGLIGHSFNTVLPVIQIADITGVWGVSALAAAANALFAEMVLVWLDGSAPAEWARVRRSAAVVFVGVGLATGYGFVRLATEPPPPLDILEVVLVQHNADPWAGNGQNAVLTAQDLSLGGEPPDLVVWSETTLPFGVSESNLRTRLERYPRGRPMSDFMAELDTPLLLGAPFSPDGITGYQNAVLLLTPTGDLMEHYGKQHLVPVAERVPLWDFGPVRWFLGKMLGLTEGWIAGDRATVFELLLGSGTTVRFGTPVCFEDSFPAICRQFVRDGADILINLTNVSWSQRESAMIQMLVAARFRAIENRRFLLRATNGGITSVIDPNGRIVAAIDPFVPQALRAEIPLVGTEELTLYTRLGDWFPLLAGVILAGALLGRYVGDYKKRWPILTVGNSTGLS